MNFQNYYELFNGFGEMFGSIQIWNY